MASAAAQRASNIAAATAARVKQSLAAAKAKATDQRISSAVANMKQRLLGSGCSFAGSTGVLMADGTVKAIDQIQPGDKVLATDPETGKKVAKRVEATHGHDDVVLTLVLTTSEGERREIRTTEDHPFWSQTEREFQRADELDPGELVLTADGGTMEVQAVLTEEVTYEPAWNLTVRGLHTYSVIATGTYVGAVTGRGPPVMDAVLVHNCPMSPGSSPGSTRPGPNSGSTNRSVIDDVFSETTNHTGVPNLTSSHRLTQDEALDAGIRWLGEGYSEIGKPGSGVFRSADGLKQFRMDNGSITGGHAPKPGHVHLEIYAPGGRKPIVNNHIPLDFNG